MYIFFLIFLENTSPIYWNAEEFCFGVLVMITLGSKARVDPLSCFIACTWWISQIQLLIATPSNLLIFSMASQSLSLHTFLNRVRKSAMGYESIYFKHFNRDRPTVCFLPIGTYVINSKLIFLIFVFP